MLDALNFVRGAVATKELTPVLTHFHVYDGRVQGYNGRIAIDAPLNTPKQMDLTVPAEKLLRALNCCRGEVTLTQKGTDLLVKSDNFTAMLALAKHADFPKTEPAKGKRQDFPQHIMDVIRILRPFIMENALYPWASGILFRDGAAFATNNAVLASMPCAWAGAGYNLPFQVIDELLRIAHIPTHFAVDKQQITFFYDGDRWVTVGMYTIKWPEELRSYLNSIPAQLPEFDGQFIRDAIEQIAPFCPDEKHDIICLGADGVKTLEGRTYASVSGTTFADGKFNKQSLLAVAGVADHIDFSKYPEACPFRGPDGILGVISGVE